MPGRLILHGRQLQYYSSSDLPILPDDLFLLQQTDPTPGVRQHEQHKAI